MFTKLKALLTRLWYYKPQKDYISSIDEYLNQFNQTHHKLSYSQIKEIKKHKRVAYLRDHSERKENQSKIWEEF